MFGRMKQHCILALLLALGACASNPVVVQSRPESAGIGLSVKVINSMILPVTYNADVVYFAKNCIPSAPCDNHIYISNYAKDGRVYWLDAPPGEYVAVATSFRQFGDPNNYITYFPAEIIQKTQVRVEQGKFAYLGDYTFDMYLGVCPDKADASQLRYAELFAPGTAKCGFLKIVGDKFASTPVIFVGNQAYAAGGGDYHYRGALRQASRDDATRQAFIARARKDLESKGWDAQLEQAEKSQGPN